MKGFIEVTISDNSGSRNELFNVSCILSVEPYNDKQSIIRFNIAHPKFATQSRTVNHTYHEVKALMEAL